MYENEEGMTETEVADSIQALLYGERLDCTLLDNASVSTFRDAGVLTHNEGLVIRTADGSEFQLTIVRSR